MRCTDTETDRSTKHTRSAGSTSTPPGMITGTEVAAIDHHEETPAEETVAPSAGTAAPPTTGRGLGTGPHPVPPHPLKQVPRQGSGASRHSRTLRGRMPLLRSSLSRHRVNPNPSPATRHYVAAAGDQARSQVADQPHATSRPCPELTYPKTSNLPTGGQARHTSST